MKKPVAAIVTVMMLGLVLAPQLSAQQLQPGTVATTTLGEIDLEQEVSAKQVGDMLIASIRYEGYYDEMGAVFAKLMAAAGSSIAGNSFCLYHDDTQGDIHDIEVCVPVSDTVRGERITTRLLAGGNFITTIHEGPYETLSQSWSYLMNYIMGEGLETGLPVREVYLVWDPADPAKNVTELQVPVITD